LQRRFAGDRLPVFTGQHRKMEDADASFSHCEEHKYLSAVDLVQVRACVELPRPLVIGQSARSVFRQPFEMTTHILTDAAQRAAEIAEFILRERVDRDIVDEEYSKFPILVSVVRRISRKFLFL
jgi:chromosome condensin MukBEF ATPase and DNA-binding subunit MukB